jgi:hypothetical protein
VIARLVLAALLASAGCSDKPAPKREDAPRGDTVWAVTITDGAGGPPIAARVVLFDAQDQPVRIGKTDLYEVRQAAASCAFAPDVIGTWDGILLGKGVAELPVGGRDPCEPSPAIPYGKYLAVAWRGPEHQIWDGEVDLGAGRGRVATTIALQRVARPEGVLAADLHVHALASNDSLVPHASRVVAQAAAGIQVIGLADHNQAGDLDDAIRALALDGVVASIASNELSGEMHVGVYPWPAGYRTDPADPAVLETKTIDELFAIARAVPGAPVVQLHHPRLRWAALYDDTGWDGVSWPPPFPLAFDAVEVLSGDTTYNAAADRPLDRSIDDFYALIDHGFLVTAVGNSDTHHLNGIRDGVTRNYVHVTAPRVAPFDEAAFVDAIRRRAVWTTSGPILDVLVRSANPYSGVGPGGALAADGTAFVEIVLVQADWVVTDTVRVRAGGAGGPVIVKELPVKRGQARSTWTVEVPLGTKDTWIGVDAIGDTALPALVTGSYLGEDNRGGGMPAALINPVLVDVDRDGVWRRGAGQVKLEPGKNPVGGRASLRRPVKPSPRKPPLTIPPPGAGSGSAVPPP